MHFRISLTDPLKLSLKTILFCSLVMTWSPASEAQTGRWETRGPDGGRIGAIAVDRDADTTLYASAGEGGVFKTTDGGTRWRAIPRGLEGDRIDLVVVDPHRSATLYAAGSAAFRSRDGGESWQSIPLGGAGVLLFHPTTPDLLYAGTGGGVYQSEDAGENWRRLSEGLPTEKATALAIDPENPSTLYAAVRNFGVFKSEDDGETWSATDEALNDEYVTALRIDSDVVFAGTFDQIWTSPDGGSSWTVRADLGYVRQIVDSPFSDVVYAVTSQSLYGSTDQGASWQSVYQRAGAPFFDLIEARSGTFYLGTACGILKTDDGGDAWRNASAGLAATLIEEIDVDPVKPEIVYASTFQCGPFKSVDGGARWRPLPIAPSARQTTSMLVDPRRRLTVYAASINGFFKSLDGGNSWNLLDTSVDGVRVLSSSNVLAISPNNSQKIYAGISRYFYSSADGGESWIRQDLDSSVVTAIAFDPRRPNTGYVASWGGFLKTTNGGAVWRSASEGLPSGGSTYALAFDPDDSTTLYVGTSEGVYRSRDAAGSWQSVGLSSSRISALAIYPIDSTIYAGTRGDGVFESENDARSWFSLGAEGVEQVQAFALSGTTLLAGGRGSAVRNLNYVCGDGIDLGQTILGVGLGVDPEVTADENGRFFITWSSRNLAVSWARAYNSRLKPQGGRFQLAAGGSPAQAGTPDGDLLTVWQEGTPSSIRGSFYRVAGSPRGETFRIDRAPARSHVEPAVARSKTGAAAVVWTSLTPAQTSVLRGRLLRSGDASREDPVFTIRDAGRNQILGTDVAMDADGRFVAVWLESGDDGLTVWAQRFRANGEPRGALIEVVSNADLRDTPPKIGAAPSGEFTIAWEEASASTQHLAARWFDSFGRPVGEERRFEIQLSAQTRTADAEIATDDFGHTMLVWNDFSVNTSQGSKIQAQVFDHAGEPISSEWTLASEGRSPRLDFSDSGEGMLVWESLGVIRAQRIRLTCSR